jgi:hypothetical protein
MTAHRIYRALDESPSLWQSLEAEDVGIAAMAFGIWNAAVTSLAGMHRVVEMLSIPLLLGLWICTVWAWMRLKSRMPRHFLKDAVEYVRLPDGFDPDADTEVIPYIGLSGTADQTDRDEEDAGQAPIGRLAGEVAS